MKKLCHRVPVFLAFLLLLTIVAGVAATAHARACAHTFEFERGNEYLQYSSSQHKYRSYTISTCTKCGYVEEVYGDWNYANHNSVVHDGGHNPTGTHTYKTKCSACDYIVRLQTIPCEGPPCIAPYSLEPIPELQ